MFHRIWAVIKRFFTGLQRGTGILPVIHGLEAHATTNTVLQVDDSVIDPQSDHLELNPVIYGLEAHATTNTALQVDDGVIDPQSDHLELNPVIHGLEPHATTNTILQVDDGVIVLQSDHLNMGAQGPIDPLTITFTKDEVKNG